MMISCLMIHGTSLQGEDTPEETVEETEPEETMGPLTPDGNMNLVDDYGGTQIKQESSS